MRGLQEINLLIIFYPSYCLHSSADQSLGWVARGPNLYRRSQSLRRSRTKSLRGDRDNKYALSVFGGLNAPNHDYPDNAGVPHVNNRRKRLHPPPSPTCHQRRKRYRQKNQGSSSEEEIEGQNYVTKVATV